MSVEERFNHERRVRDRAAALARENRYLRAERTRLEVLLGEAVTYGARHTGVSFGTLLEVFAETHAFNLARPAWVEERELQDVLHEFERTAA